MNKNKIMIIVCAVVAVLLIGICWYFFGSKQSAYVTQEPDVQFGGEVYEEAQSDDCAVISAVAGLNFYKMKETQEVSFCNNASNQYAEKITIYLADGSEVYSSDYLSPGDCVNEIEVTGLNEPGIYNGIIVYSFYTNDNTHSFVSRLETPVEIRYIY